MRRLQASAAAVVLTSLQSIALLVEAQETDAALEERSPTRVMGVGVGVFLILFFAAACLLICCAATTTSRPRLALANSGASFGVIMHLLMVFSSSIFMQSFYKPERCHLLGGADSSVLLGEAIALHCRAIRCFTGG
jgi:hypothetical protein